MNLVRSISICFPLWLLTLTIKAQNTPNYVQNFTAPSANSFGFSTIDNVQMSPFTGQIKFGIPLLSRKTAQLSASISLDYTGGGGISMYHPSSIVTKGWQLSYGGGAITRNVRGIPDDYKNDSTVNGYNDTKYNGIMYNNNNVKVISNGDARVNTTDFSIHYDDGEADSQHDIFEFGFAGYSGKFYIGKDKQVLVVPNSKLKVRIIYDTTGHRGSQIGAFIITDELGNKYYFNDTEIAWKNGNPNKTSSDTSYKYYKTYFGKKYVTTWMLSKVETPFGEESIVYTYEKDTDVQYSLWLNDFDNIYYIHSKKSTGGQNTYSNILFENQFSHLRLKSIQFSDRSAFNFSYKEPGTTTNSTDPVLRKITQTDPEGNFVDGYQFNYIWGDSTYWQFSESYFYQAVNTERLRAHLYSVNKIGKDNNLLPHCAFTYYLVNGKNEEAYFGKRGVDYWGYHNGKDNYQSVLNLLPGMSFGVSDRNPVLEYAQVGALKSITYATGGSEEFVYELNQVYAGLQNVNSGGIRLKKRILKDGINSQNDITKEYAYRLPFNESSGYRETLSFTYTYNVYNDNGGWPSNPSLKYTVDYCMSHPVNPVSMIEGSYTVYSRVEETIKNATTSNGKIIYEFTTPINAPVWPVAETFPYSPVDRPTWALGLPTRVTTYNAAGSMVKDVINQWNITASDVVADNYRSLYMGKKGEVEKVAGSPQPNLASTIYKFKNYYPVNGRAELIKTTETEYPTLASQPAVAKTTRFEYDNNYYLLRKTFASRSNGDTIETVNRYPFDYHALQAVYFRMKDSNMLKIPVATETWIKNSSRKLIAATTTEYALVNSLCLRPKKFYRSTFRGLKTETEVGTFDNKYLLQPNQNLQLETENIDFDELHRAVTISQPGSNISSVIYDSSSNIIAKVGNAAFDYIAYTSFEDYNKGNWTYNPATIVTTEGKTGFKCFSGTLSKPGLLTGNYIVSLWAKGTGTVTVNGSSKTISSAWALYEWPLNNFSGTLNINTNSNKIDELRLFPASSSITTVAYTKSAIPVTNTDINSQSLYFEYDNYNRLRINRDKDNNIIKLTDYTFKSNFLSAAQSGSFTPTCPTGYTPAADVTYPVAAGKYFSLLSQADADAKAKHDLQTFGRNYATTNGTCLQLYYNSVQSQNFTRTNCGTEEGGEVYTYTVPAKKYSTTVSQQAAENMALNDIATNGQNIANINGRCLVRLMVYSSITGYQGKIYLEKTINEPSPLVIDINATALSNHYVVVPSGFYQRMRIVSTAPQYTTFYIGFGMNTSTQVSNITTYTPSTLSYYNVFIDYDYDPYTDISISYYSN